jgi:hypothetical protein
MRRLVKWAVVTLGVAALVRWLRRRDRTAGAPAVEHADDPAEELKRKLAESRATDDETESAIEDVEPPAAPTSSVEERRAAVHDEARSALSEMTPSDEG